MRFIKFIEGQHLFSKQLLFCLQIGAYVLLPTGPKPDFSHRFRNVNKTAVHLQ